MYKLLIFVLALNLTTSLAASYEEIVSYLASDKLEGRKPGKTGNELATEYLVKYLQDLGLEPLGQSYKQEFSIFTEMLKTGNNSLQLAGKSFPFEPISYSLSGKVLSSELVFAGFGISIPQNDPHLKYDDYEGIDVKDKTVIVMTGDPAIGNPNSVFRKTEYQNYGSLFYKLNNAFAHGAKGLLLINDPMSLSQYPQEDLPYFNNAEGGGSRFSIVAGKVQNKFVNQFLKGKTTLKLQRMIAKSQRPLSFSLNKKVDLSVSLKKVTGRVSNIVAVLKPNLKNQNKDVIVLGAHMDHLGFGGESSMDPTQHGQIHNGADDNASGTAMVLKLAQALKKVDRSKTYVFSLFNAEEMGLLGSHHFVSMWSRHEKEYGKMKAMFNFDMVGRYQKEVSVMGTDTALEFSGMLGQLNSTLKVSLKKHAVGASDHASFINKKIPALFFSTGAHEDYHRSSDTAEKLDYDALRSLETYALGLITQVDKNQQIVFNPNYNTDPNQGRNRGYGAHLGCIPQFGQSDDIVGVLCTGASENSPAAMAGIRADDILVQIGDVEIKSIYDLAFALKYYRAGDEIEIAWKRGQTLHKSNIILARSRRH